VWLTSYDVEPSWGPIEVDLDGEASIGERNDWAWVDLRQPLRLDGEPRVRVLLGARHRGNSVWVEPERWPMHVYVCVPKQGVGTTSSHYGREDVTIHWGLLHLSRERADTDQY
jgi:hypothetical protein